MKRKVMKQYGKLLPYRTIETAASGDVDAINSVLKYYESYIIALSTKQLSDEHGSVHFFVDDDMRRTLETNLIVRILQFDATKVV